jgi:prevent-host-death family protein
MNLSQSIKPISYFKAHAAEVIRELNKQHGTMIITQNGEAKAVIQDIAEYERVQEALAMLRMVAQGQSDYEKGKTIPADQVLKELADKITRDFAE